MNTTKKLCDTIDMNVARYGTEPTLWNLLPLSVGDPSLTLTQFCTRLKTVLFYRAYETLA